MPTSPRAVDAECAPVWTASTSTECVAEVGAEAIRKHGMNFAQTDSRGQEGTDTISTSAAERIPKPWFWRRSFLPFFRRRKKGSRRRHDAGDYGLPRAQSVLAMTYHTRYTISPNRAQVLLSVIFMSRYWPRADLSPTRCTRRPPAVRADRGQRASSVSPSTRHRRVLPT